MRRRLAIVGAAVPWLTAAPVHAQQPDLMAFAQAYTAAWNAHDLATGGPGHLGSPAANEANLAPTGLAGLPIALPLAGT